MWAVVDATATANSVGVDEFDPDNSAANARKHGIDFVAAQQLWIDTDRIEIPARTLDESRWMVTGQITGVTYSAIFTYRSGKVRLISVRRSRKEESAIYEG